uniref:NADH dehydrogenase subunit 6 n=1 Tax=Paraschizogynium plumachela TaxID=3109024 RepID=UPI002E79266C|nr:NADH dehydrogenase subunit 6 [Paraschizogynium plumachela]WQM21760.1 NADH dehydrogenase subunit 6 [Paraschizogynium plumachela]
MKLLMILSIMFYSSFHPIFLIMLLILITLIISFMLIFLLKNSWLSLILIIIILGGMLMLFMYIASLTPNELLVKNKILYTIPPLIFMNVPNIMKLNSSMSPNMLINMFDFITNLNCIMTLTYLLLTLLSVMFIIKNINAPIRSL